MDTDLSLPARVAAVVKNELEGAGWSVLRIEKVTGIPHSTLTRRYTGLVPFTLPELAVLAHLIGTRVSALVAKAEDAS